MTTKTSPPCIKYAKRTSSSVAYSDKFVCTGQAFVQTTIWWFGFSNCVSTQSVWPEYFSAKLLERVRPSKVVTLLSFLYCSSMTIVSTVFLQRLIIVTPTVILASSLFIFYLTIVKLMSINANVAMAGLKVQTTVRMTASAWRHFVTLNRELVFRQNAFPVVFLRWVFFIL